MSIVAYYNVPEARYYAPLVVALSLLAGAASASFLRKSRNGELFVIAGGAACIAQALLLCFQPLPANFTQLQLASRPVNFLSGVRETYFLEHLAYVPPGDPWKQEWLFDLIEKAEGKRAVYLNVLSNSKPYNLGTIGFVGKLRKSKVKTTTWRGIGADISDTFYYTDDSLRCMQWVVEKTGDENGKFFDKTSRDNYLSVLEKLHHNGKYIIAARTGLPDGTELVVYRNTDWFAKN
jgi:hypothetical protein